MSVTVYRRGKPFTPPQWEEMEGPPALLLKPLPQPRVSELGRMAKGEGLSIFDNIEQILDEVLVGWRGVVDEDGQPIQFEPDKIKEMEDLLEVDVRIAAVFEALNRTNLFPGDVKNFESAFSSAPSSSPDTTAQTAEGQEEKPGEEDLVAKET